MKTCRFLSLAVIGSGRRFCRGEETDMPYCEKCGHSLEKSAQRCEVCGADYAMAGPAGPPPLTKPGPPPPPVAKKTSPPPPPVGKQPPLPVSGTTVPGSAAILPALGTQASSLPPPLRESTVSQTTAGKMPAAPVQAGCLRPQPFAVPARPIPAVPRAKSAFVPIMIVGAAVLVLLMVALGGYFFVYPRLRSAEPQPTATTVGSEPSPESASPAGSASSEPSAAPASTEEQNGTPREPTADVGAESTAEAPVGEAEQTTSVRPVRPDRSGSFGRSAPVRKEQSTLADAPTRPIPEPVSSPPGGDRGQGQSVSAAEPRVVEPAPESSERSPSAAAEETETAQVAPERQAPVKETPVYEGPKRGVVIWTGEADKGMTVVIEGASASAGQVQGALPGVACMVRLNAANVAVTEGPGPRNNYRRISLRFNKKGRFSVPVEWEVLH